MRHAILKIAVTVCAVLAVLSSDTRAEDIYEPDDLSSQARVMVVDDIGSQRHDFSKALDEDWVKFYAVAGIDYEITVKDAGPNCDAVIELFGPDGTTLISRKDDNPAGMTERLAFRADNDSLTYIKIRNYFGMRYGDGTAYDLRVYRPIGPPIAGILTGRVYEYSTGTPIEDAVLRSSGGGSGISIDSGHYFLRDYNQLITVDVKADGCKPFTTDVVLTPAAVTTLDVPMEIDPAYSCQARLQGDLALLIPRILVGDAMIWATLKYDPTRQDKVVFEVMGYGSVPDTSGFSACASPAVITGLILDLPAISFGSMLLRAHMELESIDGSRIFFEVKAAEIISNSGL